MNRGELRARAGELRGFEQRFDQCFGRRESREHAARYVRGFLTAEGRKSVHPYSWAAFTLTGQAD